MTFIILQQCVRDVFLGMDFLSQHGAVIDLTSKSITLSTDQVIPPERTRSCRDLSVLEDQVSTLPHARIMISIGAEAARDIEAIINNNQHLLLNCCMTAPIA